MAFPTVTTASPANINPSGFVNVYAADASTNLWQTLGAISNGVMNIKDFSTADSVGRNRTNGACDFTAKCNMMQCSLTELELLDSICNGTNAFLFKLPNAGAIPTGGTTATVGWIKVLASQVGVKAKVNADGTPENNRVIELEFQGSIILGLKDDCLKASIDDDQFASSADSATAPYYAIGTYSAAKDGGNPKNGNIKPCGVASITLADNAGGSPVTMSPFQNVKFSLEMLATQDSIRRHLPNSLDINLEYDWMASDAADLILLDGMIVLNVNPVVTMLDGVIFTFVLQTGIETNYEVAGDMDKNQVVRFIHKGKVLQSSLDGIVS